MIAVKLFRKFGKLLRGGAGTREIFLGGLLGVLIGMIPGFNLTLLLSIFLLLLLNANVGIAILGFALGKVLCILLAPVTFQIGYAIIHQAGLEGLFQSFSETPVLALLDLHVYCLVGGLPVAIILGLVVGSVLSLIIRGLRKGIVEATSRSDKVQKLGQNKFVRFLLWLAFGSQKKALSETMQKRSPLIRKGGVALAVVVIVLLLGAEFFLIDMFVKAGLEKELGAANGAEVNVGSAHLSLLGGEVSLSEIQFGDPKKPTHNLFQAETLRADISIGDLLAKRYAIDLLEARNVFLDAPRSEPAQVFKEVEEEKETEAEDPQEALLRILEKAEWVKKHLEKLRDYLEKGKEEGPDAKEEDRDKEDLKKEAQTSGYLALSAKNLVAQHPTWLVRKIIVDGIVLKKGGAPQKLEGQDLSSHPALHAQPMKLSLSQTGVSDPIAALEFNFQGPDALHRVLFNLRDVALGDAITLSDDTPLDVKEGTAQVSGDGEFSVESLKIPFSVAVSNLKAQAREGKSVLGLDPKTAQEVFRHLEEFQLSGTLEGSLLVPIVKLDEKQVLENLKEALVRAGQAELARRANEQLEKLSGRLSEKMEKAIDKKLKDKIPDELKDKIPSALEGILPGLGGKKEKGKEGKEESGIEETVSEGLDSIFQGLGGKKKKKKKDEKK